LVRLWKAIGRMHNVQAIGHCKYGSRRRRAIPPRLKPRPPRLVRFSSMVMEGRPVGPERPIDNGPASSSRGWFSRRHVGRLVAIPSSSAIFSARKKSTSAAAERQYGEARAAGFQAAQLALVLPGERPVSFRGDGHHRVRFAAWAIGESPTANTQGAGRCTTFDGIHSRSAGCAMKIMLGNAAREERQVVAALMGEHHRVRPKHGRGRRRKSPVRSASDDPSG